MNDDQGIYVAPHSELENLASSREINYFKGWLIFFLVASIGGGIFGAVVGGVIGFVLGSARVSIATIQIISGIFGFVVALPISYFSFKWCVKKYIIVQTVVPIQNEVK